MHAPLAHPMTGRSWVVAQRPQRSAIGTQLSRVVAHASRSNEAEASNPVLEALSYGRAVVETVNERLVATLAPQNVLAEVGKVNSELAQAVKDFQEEVAERAQHGLQEQQQQQPALPLPLPAPGGTSASAGGASRRQRGGSATSRQQAEKLSELVDNLRADIAATRAVLQQIKAQQGAGAAGAAQPGKRR